MELILLRDETLQLVSSQSFNKFPSLLSFRQIEKSLRAKLFRDFFKWKPQFLRDINEVQLSTQILSAQHYCILQVCISRVDNQ